MDNARDPQAQLPSEVLRALYGRAVRVHDVLDSVRTELDARILAGAEAALAQDSLLRFLCPEPDDLIASLRRVSPRLAIHAEMERKATTVLTNRPLGMADPVDFEAWMAELVTAANSLSNSSRTLPTYSTVMLHLLEMVEPQALRDNFVEYGGMDPVLFLSHDTEDALMHWFARSGMRVEQRSGPTHLIYWGTANDLSPPHGEVGRDPMHEHHLAARAVRAVPYGY